MCRKFEVHLVDGRPMTTREIAGMLGVSEQALYCRRSRLGGCSYQVIVDMYRENAFGSDHFQRWKIDGKWCTTKQIAEMLRIHPHSLVNWRCANRQPDGSPASMEEAIAYFRQYLTGERVRWQGYGGGRPWKVYMVNGRPVTVLDVSRRFGKTKSCVYHHLYACGHDMGKVIAWFEERARHQKAVERRKMEKAERKILRILGY